MIGRPTKGNPMDAGEMLEAARAERARGSKIYSKAETLEANQQGIGRAVLAMARTMEQGSDASRQFDLSDFQQLNKVAIAYTRACALAGSLPSVSGLAGALGRSRTGLYEYGKVHAPFREWLQDYSDLCAEAAISAAIEGSAQAVPAIFLAKARAGWKDNDPVELRIGRADTPLGEAADPATIAAKYHALPED